MARSYGAREVDHFDNLFIRCKFCFVIITRSCLSPPNLGIGRLNNERDARTTENLILKIMPTKDYQTDLLKRLANADYAAQYLKVAFDEALIEGNKSAFLLALKNVIDTNGRMPTLEN